MTKEMTSPVKSESPAIRSHFVLSEMTPESVWQLEACLQRTGLACQDLRDDILRWRDDSGRMSEAQQHQQDALTEEVAHLRQENIQARAELHEQRTNHNLLVGDMARLCDDKQRLQEERDTAAFQKAVSDLILDQYRDETTEQRQVIVARDADLRDLANTCASLDSEVSSLRGLCSDLEQCIAAGKQTLAEVRRELEDSRALLSVSATSKPPARVHDSGAYGTEAAGSSTTGQLELEKEKRKRKRRSRKERRRGKAGMLD